MTKATFALRGRNPDVLTCIANLSNDAVFTPPEFANRMLDTLSEAWSADNDGANIWADPDVTFLDPFTKSGVFLREIVTRLTVGLEDSIPDLAKRVDHILTKQVLGIGTETLTALLARRSVYCSKYANGPHSIATSFDTESGNIWFERTDHTWVGGTERILDTDADGKTVERTTNGRCKYCGASQKEYERDKSLESHAYAFIHTDNIKARIAELFGDDMHFDVIIGNPPYQLSDGGHGASAVPIYHRFVQQAKALEPRMLSMVIPARWFAGGRGLDSFRSEMLSDHQIRTLVDYPDSRDCFQGVDVAGGVCYFLWERDTEGECEVVSFSDPKHPTNARRALDEWGSNVFVRHNEATAILEKVFTTEGFAGNKQLPDSRSFRSQVSAQKPFGFRTFFRGTATRQSDDDVLVVQSGGRAWVGRELVAQGADLIDKWKVFTSKSSSEHAGQVDSSGRRRVLSLTGVLPPESVVTETYVLLGAFDAEENARNCLSYVTTCFFRFLIAIRSSSQDISRPAYSFIPMQDFTKSWTDEELYAKYGLTDEEIAFIESLVRPMETSSD